METNKVIDRNACAYKEIYEILQIFPRELVNEIPKDKIEFFYKNMDRNYNYNISIDTFDGQTMLDETAAILTILFRDYWANQEQREKLFKFTKNAQNVIEEEEREKYNPDNLFKNRNMNNFENIQKEQALIMYEEKNFIQRIFEKIKKFFKLK